MHPAAANSFGGDAAAAIRLMQDRDAAAVQAASPAGAANCPARAAPTAAKNFYAPLETKFGFF
jgi:hypothetical protein